MFICKFHLFDNQYILDFLETHKFQENHESFSKWEYYWNQKVNDLKKFIPKFVRRSIKDKHGIVDGSSFFVHLMELRLFLQTMPAEVVFLSFKAENKFSAETKYILAKMVLGILGKYLVSPDVLGGKSVLGQFTLNDCIKKDRRVFVFFKPKATLF